MINPVTIIKSDVMMMICKTRVKPFDVSIKNRMMIMTSGGRVTQLVNEWQVKRRKGGPTTDKIRQQKKNCQPKKQFIKTFFKTDISLS